MKATSAWHGDWHRRIHAAVNQRGFSSVTEFARAMPHASLIDLARALGDSVAAAQVEALLRAEAENAGTEVAFAKDLLVRRLRQRIPRGWGVGDDFETDVAGAWAAWKQGLPERYADAVWRLWDKVKSLDIPYRWLPEGPDDPIIERAFAGAQFGAPDTDA